MDESSSQAIYTGAYILIFVMALTVTLYLFNSIIDFADLAYKFNTKLEDSSTIVDAPAQSNRLLSGNEVISYYYNYIKHDLYSEKKSNINYIVTIQGLRNEDAEKMSLKEISDAIGQNNKYILSYKAANYDAANRNIKNVYIEINKATQEQIDALV